MDEKTCQIIKQKLNDLKFDITKTFPKMKFDKLKLYIIKPNRTHISSNEHSENIPSDHRIAKNLSLFIDGYSDLYPEFTDKEKHEAISVQLKILKALLSYVIKDYILT